MCLTPIEPNAHYDPIPVKKPHMSSRRINDPGIIAACHCGVEYEIEYSASIETHTTTSIDSANQKSTDNPHDESEDTLLHHSSWKRNAPSIDIPGSPLIDTQPHQRNRKRASTDITNYSSIDAEVNRVREGDYSIGIWTNDHHHESYVVETTIYEPGADELHEGFTYEELLNMQRRDETAQHQSETDDFWKVVKEEKVQEGDFEVESLMSFSGSYWCRSTPDFEYRSTSASPNRSTGSPEHRPMTPTESTASYNAVRILTHEEFTAKHPHPPSPDNVRIARRADTYIDRHEESTIARQRDVNIDGDLLYPQIVDVLQRN
ncbi:hypothetical protein F2Q69_00029535 [Brassica cretica]|uniref:Uncharacterized protein n=1 Tax=Brassica cretica TaxID=69181 RepID=A0A8S9SB97_BRACR|nr:hypothetical protein F2Q69_00029535 [Brassica cretica]